MGIQYFQKPQPLRPIPINTVPAALEAKLGSGLAFPAQVIQNVWKLAKGLDKVKQNILVALFTPVGRRFIRPDYGSLLLYLLFENYDDLIHDELIQATVTCLQTHLAQQIKVGAVLIDESMLANNSIIIDISYQILGSMATDKLRIGYLLQESDSVVFPPDVFVINGRQVLAPGN